MPPLKLREGQLRRAIAACAAPLAALGFDIPDEHDLTDQALAVRVDQLRLLLGLAAREVLKGCSPGRRVLGAGVEFGRPDALGSLGLTDDIPEGQLPRVSTLRPAREVELGGLEEMEPIIPEPPKAQVFDLMAALKASIAATRNGGAA